MRRILFPCAAFLGIVLVLQACDSPAPSAPETGLIPASDQLAMNLLEPPKKGVLGCPEGFNAELAAQGDPVDRNQDGVICVKPLPNGRKILVDNNVPRIGKCPPNFKPKEVEVAHDADLNRNGRICKRELSDGKVLFTDDAVEEDEA